jgi:hypothetical protein
LKLNSPEMFIQADLSDADGVAKVIKANLERPSAQRPKRAQE